MVGSGGRDAQTPGQLPETEVLRAPLLDELECSRQQRIAQIAVVIAAGGFSVPYHWPESAIEIHARQPKDLDSDKFTS
jgi:hypothetical protein